MKHKASLTISRPFYGDDRKKISIKVRDKKARIMFLELQIDLDKFTQCLTGLSEVDCDMDVYNLENVGKVEESMDLIFEVGAIGYGSDRKNLAYKLAKKIAPKGWIVSDYFGSQNSFFNKDGKQMARTTASRWVDK